MSSIDFNKIEKGAFVKESIDILHQAYMSKKLVLFVGAGEFTMRKKSFVSI